MKNQNDLIFAIAAVVVTIGVVIAMIFMARKPATVPAVTPVPLAEVTVPVGTVVYSDSLPNAGDGAASSAFGSPGGGGALGGAPAGGDGPVATGATAN